MTGPSKELSEIRASVHEAIDRNRNERQKTILLTFKAAMIRQHSTSVRERRSGTAAVLNDNCVRVPSSAEALAPELPKQGQKRPVQSIRTIPSA